jgi:hypothetical protein
MVLSEEQVCGSAVRRDCGAEETNGEPYRQTLSIVIKLTIMLRVSDVRIMHGMMVAASGSSRSCPRGDWLIASSNFLLVHHLRPKIVTRTMTAENV